MMKKRKGIFKKFSHWVEKKHFLAKISSQLVFIFPSNRAHVKENF